MPCCNLCQLAEVSARWFNDPQFRQFIVDKQWSCKCYQSENNKDRTRANYTIITSPNVGLSSLHVSALYSWLNGVHRTCILKYTHSTCIRDTRYRRCLNFVLPATMRQPRVDLSMMQSVSRRCTIIVHLSKSMFKGLRGYCEYTEYPFNLLTAVERSLVQSTNSILLVEMKHPLSWKVIVLHRNVTPFGNGSISTPRNLKNTYLHLMQKVQYCANISRILFSSSLHQHTSLCFFS